MKTYWRLILGRPRLTIGIFAVVLVLSCVLIANSRFNFAFEPKNVLSADEYAELIGSSDMSPRESLALILTPSREGAVSRDFTRDVSEVLSSHPGVRFAASQALIPEEAKSDFFEMEGGRQLVLMEIEEEGYLSIHESRALMAELDDVVRPMLGEGVSYEFVGPSPTRIALHKAFRRDVLVVTIPLAIVILFLPFFLYRSWSYVFLPGFAGLLTVAVSMALYGCFGENFTYFSITLAPLILCLALMDAMYLVDRFWSKAAMHGDRSERIRAAVRELIFPCSLTTVTTATGFASLALISDTPILKEYGLFAAIGIVLALAIVFLLMPAILTIWPEPGTSFVARSEGIGRRITAVAIRASSHPKKVVLAFLLCAALTVPFLRHISVEGSFEEFFSSDHPTQSGIDSLVDHLGSLSPMTFTVYSTTPEESTRMMHFAHTRFFERWLGRKDYIGRTLSPLAFLSKPEAERRPGETIIEFRNRVERELQGYDLTEVAVQSGDWIALDPEGSLESIRIVAWPGRLNAEEYDTFMQHLDNFNRTMMGEFRFKLGGTYLLERVVEDRFLREMVQSLLLSGALVLLITLIPLRSWRLSLVFLIINCFPLAMVAGLMGFLEIPFSLALIGLPCILFGIIVDDSIHTLWSFKRTGSIQETYNRKGRAILITSLLLAVAFGGQALSAFKTNRQFGELAAVGIVLAFLADLVLAPALLRVVARRRSSQPEQ